MKSPQPVLDQVVLRSFVGPLIIAADAAAIRSLRFVSGAVSADKAAGRREDVSPILLEALRQVEEYLSGVRRVFELPVRLDGTPFQQAVWREIGTIPYGAVATYGEIAVRIGRPRSARAVGQALRRNPIPIIVPCHRVVGSGRELGGFTPDVAVKRSLLGHEGVADLVCAGCLP